MRVGNGIQRRDAVNGFTGPATTDAYGNSNTLSVQNELFGGLDDAQAQDKMQGDFGLGSNNNAATTNLLAQAGGTAAKYSKAFGGQADAAAAASAAAAARGTGIYAGDTAGYTQALGNAQQDRGMQTGAYDKLMDFAAQPQGPSAAQAQLTQATMANQSNALALARSGRGMGGGAAALRSAIGQNAQTQQQSNAQAAELMANENTAFQAQRLNAINAAGGIGSAAVSGDQGTAASGLAGAQYHTNTQLQGTQLNDAAAQAWATQQQNATQQGLGAESYGQTQSLNVDASALAGRESQWASANQTHGIDTGNATQAGIADANRQQAYVGAGLAAGGSIAAIASDERVKTNITPLGVPMAGNDVKPLPSQAPADSGSGFASKSAADAQQRQATGGAVGGAAGGIAGAAVGSLAGPVGTVAGGAVGNIAGKAIGKLIGSDVRSKTDIAPLSAAANGLMTAGGTLEGQKDASSAYARLMALSGGQKPADSTEAVDKYAEKPKSEVTQLSKDKEAGFQKWLKQNNVRDLDNPDSHYDYRGAYLAGVGRGGDTGHFPDTFKQHGHPTFSIESQYSQNANDGGTWEGEKFSPAVTPRAPDTGALDAAFSREGGTPVISKGDALLADSARHSPGYMYQYKDPQADGAGTYTGPMAQDLAAHPVTQSAVGQDPQTGKLYVNGPRLATINTAQNHSQQNQLDALDAKIDALHSMLKSPDYDALDESKRRATAGGY